MDEYYRGNELFKKEVNNYIAQTDELRNTISLLNNTLKVIEVENFHLRIRSVRQGRNMRIKLNKCKKSLKNSKNEEN